jgi:hypothetical protein
MATVLPRVGQRGILNSNLVSELNTTSLTIRSTTVSEYYGIPNNPITYYCTNLSQNTNSPITLNPMFLIDTSGNLAWKGTLLPTNIYKSYDVSLNVETCSRITNIYFSSDNLGGLSTGLRLIIQYPNWGSNNVCVTADVMCTGRQDIAAYSCVGEIFKNNLASPNEEYFDTLTTGLTTTNGNVFVSSLTGSGVTRQPYALIFRFVPTSPNVHSMTGFIKLVSSTTESQITSITLDKPP